MAVNATAIWRVRPSGVNTNGGGYDGVSYPGGTDYSQQNAAQATGTNGSGAATTTFTDATAAAFTSAMVGNAINITGQGVYFVVTFTSTTQVVVDRALGTFSGATWHLGGGWADFWTNTTVTAAILVAGNIVYVLGSGTPNPSSYTYDYTAAGVSFRSVAGTNSVGRVQYLNDPHTPSYKAPPDTTGGMPVIKFDGSLTGGAMDYTTFSGLWFVASATTSGTVLFNHSGNGCSYIALVYDAFGIAVIYNEANGNGSINYACEIFSSVSSGATMGLCVYVTGTGAEVRGCNIHDIACNGQVINAGAAQGVVIRENIVSNCPGTGIYIDSGSIYACVENNTVDANGGHGIYVNGTNEIITAKISNNIVTNQTGVGKFGLTVNSGTATANSSAADFVDYNVFYNNTANYNGINAGLHDSALGVSPYVNQSTENYTLA